MGDLDFFQTFLNYFRPSFRAVSNFDLIPDSNSAHKNGLAASTFAAHWLNTIISSQRGEISASRLNISPSMPTLLYVLYNVSTMYTCT